MNFQPPPISDSPALGGFDNLKPDDELLVAYLDGELDQGSASQIELKLAGDDQLRRRLNDLRAAWDLLEDLPPAEPNPRFAQSTIEMVAMNAASLTEKKTGRRGAWRWPLVLLVMLPLMFALGYGVVRVTQRLAERQAIEYVHILADWDALKEVKTYEWLQQIRKVRDLDRVAKRSATSSLGTGLVPPTNSQRRAWIQDLSGTNRDRLSANLVAFKLASPAERQRILELAKQIYEGPDPLGNLQAARDYAHFISEMSISDRAAHHDEQDLVARGEDLTRRVNRRMVEVYTKELTEDSPDRIAVRKWIQDMGEQYGSSLRVRSDLRRRMLESFDSSIYETDLDNLLQNLTPEAQEIISRIRNKQAQHFALILYFIDDSQPFFPGGSSRRTLDRAQLTEQFKKLPDSRRGMIEFLPPEIAQQNLGMRSETDSRNGAGGRPSRNPAPSFNPGTTPGARNELRQDLLKRGENDSNTPPP